MLVILFDYNGTINIQPIKSRSNKINQIIAAQIIGKGSLNADPETGKFSASAFFEQFPAIFHPFSVGVSIFGIACSHGSYSNYGVPNIYNLSNGNYRSRREIVLVNNNPQKNNNQIIIEGNFQKVSPNIYRASVEISGNYIYNNQLNYKIPPNYALPLTNQANPNSLQGNFSMGIPDTTGGTTPITINHIYQFTNGTTLPIRNCITEVFYNAESFWDINKKELFLSGTSIIK